MLRLLATGFDELILTRFVNNPRAVPPEELQKLCDPTIHDRVILAPDPATALAAARQRATPNDLICVTGSFFLAGEVRDLLGE